MCYHYLYLVHNMCAQEQPTAATPTRIDTKLQKYVNELKKKIWTITAVVTAVTVVTATAAVTAKTTVIVTNTGIKANKKTQQHKNYRISSCYNINT